MCRLLSFTVAKTAPILVLLFDRIYTFPKIGIEYAIEAFLGLFSGQNLGKMTLEVATEK